MSAKSEDGFTLIEVLVSFAILSGAILLAFESGSNSFRAMAIAAQKTKAMEVLRTEVNRTEANDTVLARNLSGVSQGVTWKIDLKTLGDDQDWLNLLRPYLVHATGEPGGAEIESITLKRVQP